MRDVVERRCGTCVHHSGGTMPTCRVPLPDWIDPHTRGPVYQSEGDNCPLHDVDLDAPDEITRLRADVARLREVLDWHLRSEDIKAAALSEIKATSDGESEQPISAIVDWCVEQISGLPDRPNYPSLGDMRAALTEGQSNG